MTPRVGLIGFGLAGRYFHAPLILAAGLDLRAVVTSRAQEARQVCPGILVVDSAADVTARNDIDLIVIASPNQLHFPQARDALLAGKHVVVDKPLSITAAEAHSLSDLARERELTLAVFQNRRWDSDFLTIRKLLDEQRLGEIVAFRARWDRFRPTVADRWRERAEPGGGVLYDLGSHLIDQALCLFGRPQWLQADVFTQRAGGVADDGFEIRMGNGPLRISLGVSSLAANGDWRYCIHGTRGSFYKTGLDPQEEQLRADKTPDDAGFGIEPDDRHGRIVSGTDGQTQTIVSERGHWVSFYIAVRQSIENNAPVPVSATQAAQVLEIIQTARRSSDEGRRILLT